MKVTVITGSPRKQGATALLAEEFIKGAKEAGHDVFRFDAAFEKVAPCLACDRCRADNEKCVQSDSMEKLNPELLAADYIVFVSPLYYFGMSAQIKAVIDRFYAKNSSLMGGKNTVLMSACHASDDWAMPALADHYKTILKYLKWNDGGILLAVGCGERDDIKKTDYPSQAYQMGKKIK